jgi:EAL domain-containing protein (putative c-di-GMP-specific phosphodiesterase class I)
MIDFEAIHAGFLAGEFYLDYLPIVTLADGRCVGAEALIRWRRPGGIVPPLDFIPVIENTPLSGLVTYWVIETVAKELGAWLRAHDGVHLSINVPPEVLGRGGLEYAASKCGLSDVAQKIVLEVTERGVPDNLGVDALSRAARKGVRVALDDVQVSAANMVVLSRCNVGIIKIDRDVVGQLGRGDEPPGLLAGVSALLRTTNLQVIAEGVETAEQAAALHAAGISMAQGYYFSRPISARAFEEFFRAPRERCGCD